VLRFNERAAPWQRLRAELSASGDRPVLLSGFPDTVRPFLVACLLREQPHVLGESITRFWPSMGPALPPLVGSLFHPADFKIRLTRRELEAAIWAQRRQWPGALSGLAGRSVQAVVPVGHDFPEEWREGRDVYAPRRVHFENICDVLYRNEPAISLAPGMAGPLGRDNEGPYRALSASGPVLVHDRAAGPLLVCLHYDGEPGAVKLCVKGRTWAGQAVGPGPRAVVCAHCRPDELEQLTLVVERPVKLRSLTSGPDGVPPR
jgi:hypothetical protein